MVSDEKIISTLLSSGTVKESAKKLGISESTIYNRMKEKRFTNKIDWVKWEILEQLKDNLIAESSNAIAVISGIMNDSEVNSAVRLQSAQAIINTSLKFLEVANRANESLKESIEDEWLDIPL